MKCGYLEIFRGALAIPVKERLYTESTSRTNLDMTASCSSCQREAGASRIVCPPCGGVWHRYTLVFVFGWSDHLTQMVSLFCCCGSLRAIIKKRPTVRVDIPSVKRPFFWRLPLVFDHHISSFQEVQRRGRDGKGWGSLALRSLRQRHKIVAEGGLWLWGGGQVTC